MTLASLKSSPILTRKHSPRETAQGRQPKGDSPWETAHGRQPMGDSPWETAHGRQPMGDSPWETARGSLGDSAITRFSLALTFLTTSFTLHYGCFFIHNVCGRAYGMKLWISALNRPSYRSIYMVYLLVYIILYTCIS